PDGPWHGLGTVFTVPDPPPSFVPGFHYTRSFTYNAVVLTSTRFADGGFLGSYDVNTFDPREARRDGRMVGPRFVSIHVPPPPAAPRRAVVAPGPSPWTPTFAVDRAGVVRTVNGGVGFGRSYTARAVAVARTPTARGGWVAAADGGVFAFGDARFFGSMGGVRLSQPVVGMAATPTGHGYWLVARDGGVFTFGDARFHGSAAGQPPPYPVTGMAATPDGLGYWLVTVAGQAYAYGRARYAGNARSLAPGIGVVPAPGGYRIVDSAGEVWTLGVSAGVTRIPTPTPLVAAG
ncbi:MAG TPA: hypothetical protein VIK61_15225, partial [Acidimicrobiia bacterium]